VGCGRIATTSLTAKPLPVPYDTDLKPVATGERIFVDTDILIDVFRRVPRAVDFWRRAEARGPMICSVISVFELVAGCRNRREQRQLLRHISAVQIVHVESGDSRDALHWYQAFYLSQGIGFLDCVIAAGAARLGCVLHTLNTKHFRVIPGLSVKRPY
jgi:predicted nucleic acid-binding protein